MNEDQQSANRRRRNISRDHRSTPGRCGRPTHSFAKNEPHRGGGFVDSEQQETTARGGGDIMARFAGILRRGGVGFGFDVRGATIARIAGLVPSNRSTSSSQSSIRALSQTGRCPGQWRMQNIVAAFATTRYELRQSQAASTSHCCQQERRCLNGK